MVALHGVTTNGAAVEGLFRPPLQMSGIAYDLRGHGESTWEPPFTLAQHVSDLRGLVEAVGTRVVLAGHSFGGLIALHAAVSQPEAFEALVLLDPALEVDQTQAADVPDGSGDAGSGHWASWPSLEAARGAYQMLLDPDTAREGMKWFDENRLLRADGTVALPFSATAVAAAWDEMTKPLPQLGALQVRTLLVVAQRGSLTSPRACQALIDLGSRVRVETVPTGHDLIWANPTLIGSVVADFLGH